MRIGLFTDMYFPAVNGVTYVVEGVYQELTRQGHEVYIFAPAESFKHSLARALRLKRQDPHIIRLASIDGSILFEDFKASLFFPPKTVARIRSLNLDVIHFFVPAQVGLLGVYAAKKLNIPLVGQYCTDLFRYVEYYPRVLPAILALSMSLPFSVPRNEYKQVFQLLIPRRRVVDWNKDIVRDGLRLVHHQCNAVIAPSRKVSDLLESWGTRPRPVVIPNGVDALTAPTARELAEFKKKYRLIGKKVVLNVGRLTAEKNLTLLIDALVRLRRRDSDVVLVFTGGAEYQKHLLEYARQKKVQAHVRFTGPLPRERLGVAYAVGDVFAFPSLTDTQGLVLHEAAQAGLPLVTVDPGVTEVLQDGRNGFIAGATPAKLASKLAKILDNPVLRQQFAQESKKIAAQYTEAKQIKKLVSLYAKIVREHDEKIHLRS